MHILSVCPGLLQDSGLDFIAGRGKHSYILDLTGQNLRTEMGYGKLSVSDHDFVRKTGPHDPNGAHPLHQDKHSAAFDNVCLSSKTALQGTKRIFQGFVI